MLSGGYGYVGGHTGAQGSVVLRKLQHDFVGRDAVLYGGRAVDRRHRGGEVLAAAVGVERDIGEIDENKGLSRINVGDPVYFTVDAFGGKKFVGVVDEVSPTSNQSGVVFNISDQRAVQQFNIKARFDTTEYPELRNGMSARMYVYVK